MLLIRGQMNYSACPLGVTALLFASDGGGHSALRSEREPGVHSAISRPPARMAAAQDEPKQQLELRIRWYAADTPRKPPRAP